MSASLSLGYFFMLILSKICKLSRDSLQTTMRGLNMESETVISASSKETCRTENVKDKVFCNVQHLHVWRADDYFCSSSCRVLQNTRGS